MGNRYDVYGTVISKETYCELIERRSQHRYGIIGLDTLANYLVETVWTGVPTTFDSFGCPHIFETIVFKFAEGHEVTQRPERWVYWKYTALEDAERGHEAFLDAIRKSADWDAEEAPA